MITVFQWTSAKGGEYLDGIRSLPGSGQLPELLWIDLEAPSPEEEQQVFQSVVPVHPLTLEDITRMRREPDQPPHFPKVEEFPDYLFVIVNPLCKDAVHEVLHHREGPDSRRINTQLSAVLTDRILITHHYEPLDSVQELKNYLEKHSAQASRGPDFLYHIILDVMVDRYAPVLDMVEEHLDELELAVFSHPSAKLLSRLLGLKRGIIGLRKTMIYEREILARLSRGEFELIDEKEMVYYRNVYDHLIRFTELIESSREMTMDLMQTLLASQANKLNEIMKVLTMISTTVMPMTLLAGIYGMNFENNVWPDFKSSPFGFPMVLMGMMLSGLGAFGFFRWMKWI